MRNLKYVGVAIVVFGLAGCAQLSPYQIPAGTKHTAQIYAKHVQTPVIIVNGKQYKLMVDANGFTQVPAGHRIVVANNYSVTQGGLAVTQTVSCMPKVSFIPSKLYQYYLDFNIRRYRCYLNILRRPKGSKDIFEFDPTAEGV